ncbi:hypothetical protein CJF30_00002132 [Rutstroemia sp. NJR-2017a BBW]|nr:hypothetical protein CJF30_00002132 [Rutstroemia sp. NJR-2017a BBW]
MDQVQIMHVVSKANNAVTATVELKPTDRPLASSSIRVATSLISLSSNNLSYARGGDFLHWWDTYPVPSTAPAPYNDTKLWGIVPAWGYATVLETTSPITPGTVIWGFWPTSSGHTDLKVQQSSIEGHWTEVSEHRSQLMTIYNQYRVVPDIPSVSSLQGNELHQAAWEILFRPTWGTGYLIAQYVFAPETQPPIHPLGIDANWTAEDADLSHAVVISLSASGKTARSCAWHLAQRPKTSGALGILQISSSPNIGSKDRLPMATRTVTYNEIPSAETLEWVTGLKPSRIVILDFGGRGNSLDDLLASLNSDAVLKSLEVTILQIGSEQKIYTKEEILAGREKASRLGKVLYNTSGVRDAVIACGGREALVQAEKAAWEKWIGESREFMPDMQIKMGVGIKGSDGVEGGWERLCKGSVGATEGLVYKL